MRARLTNPTVRDAITLVVAASALLTGLLLFLSEWVERWLWVGILAAALINLAVMIIRRKKLWPALTRTSSFVILALVFQEMPHLSGLLAEFGLGFQVTLVMVLLFPLAYFWEGPQELLDAPDDDDGVTRIFVLVLAGCGLCVGVGYLVTRSAAWVWLILGLWGLVFPKGLADRKFPPLAALAGLAGLGLVIAAVLSDQVDRYALLYVTGTLFVVMLVISLVALVGPNMTGHRSVPFKRRQQP
jgi:hypothetical protein